MTLRRLVTTFAVAALAAAGACSKEAGPGTDADSRQGVGAKIDRALDAAQRKLERAGEKAKEEIAEATGKTQETLSKAGDTISAKTSSVVSGARDSLPRKDGAPPSTPPYSPRQPVQEGAATSGSDTTTTTATLSTGPTTSVKTTSVAREARERLNDAAITASIKADFLKDPDLSVLKIDVDTRDGVVTLNGLAENEPAKRRAERMAESVKGVKEVRNYLTLKRG